VTDERRRIDEFVHAATAFRELCENAQELGRDRFLLGLSKVLPRLQAAAAALPVGEPASDELPFEAGERPRRRPPDAVWKLLPDDWSEVQGNLHETVDGNESPATALLANDLDDMYGDVMEGFDILDAGLPESEAVWHWRFDFWTHWGYHVAEAQRLIHYHVALHGLHSE